MRTLAASVCGTVLVSLLACTSGSGGGNSNGGLGGKTGEGTGGGAGGGSGGQPNTGGAPGSGGATCCSVSTGGTAARGGASGGDKESGGTGGGSGGSAQGGAAGSSAMGGAGGATTLHGGSSGSTGGSGAGGTNVDASAGGTSGSGGASGTGGSAVVKHRFLKGGHTSQSVAIVAADGAIEWEYPIADETSDAWLLPNGNVIFAFAKGVREVTPAKATVWEYLAPSGAETQSCQPLPNDRFLIGEAHGDGTSFLYEMGRDKQVSKTVTLKTTSKSAHDEFRQVRKTPAGTYLVTQQRTGGKAQEYDGDGKLLRTFPCGRFVAIRLPDGNTLISCGDDHRVIEVDTADTIVWEVKENDVPGNKLMFAAGLQRLSNGNTVIANWSGHVGSGEQPQVFEITRDKKVVWQVKDTKLNLISTIAILDSDAAVGGVLLR